MIRFLIIIGLLSIVQLSILPPLTFAHPGKRDNKGCHYCRTNCDKWGVPWNEKHCHDGKGKPKKEKSDSTNSGADTLPDGQRAYVEKVSDGDTLKVRLLPGGSEQATIRIQGIDCPESRRNSKCEKDGRQGRLTCDQQVPLGKKASKRAAELLKHKTVTLESGVVGKALKKGYYGRWLAYIKMEDGRDFGLLMIKEGLCEDFGWKYPHARGERYKNALPTKN